MGDSYFCYLVKTPLLYAAFRKKVNKLAKEKGCDIIGQWSKSMVNHLYWCALSTKSGDGEEMLEKWLSLLNHVHNKHRGHGKLYKKCTHSRLRNRKWLKHCKCLYKIDNRHKIDF